jgi:hypothetical protein
MRENDDELQGKLIKIAECRGKFFPVLPLLTITGSFQFQEKMREND